MQGTFAAHVNSVPTRNYIESISSIIFKLLSPYSIESQESEVNSVVKSNGPSNRDTVPKRKLALPSNNEISPMASLSVLLLCSSSDSPHLLGESYSTTSSSSVLNPHCPGVPQGV